MKKYAFLFITISGLAACTQQEASIAGQKNVTLLYTNDIESVYEPIEALRKSRSVNQ